MQEKDILKKIEESAEDVRVPENLEPEKVAAKLAEQEKKNPAEKKIFFTRRSMVSAAAVALMICVLGSMAARWNRDGEGMVSSQGTVAENIASGQSSDRESTGSGQIAGGENRLSGQSENEDGNSSDAGIGKAVPNTQKKQDAGELYLVASSYEEVYENLQEYGLQENVTADSFAMAETDQSPVVDTASTNSYSDTNLQVLGVDESDIVKTDGDYLYVVDDDMVHIIDIRGDMPEETGKIVFSGGKKQTWVQEIYVDGNKLVLIAQQLSLNLESGAVPYGSAEPYDEGNETGGEDEIYMEDSDTEEVILSGKSGLLPLENSTSAADVAYNVESSLTAIVMTYDITDRRKPVLSGEIRQDGYYETSRKIGDIVYLFTTQGLMNRLTSYSLEDAGKMIPLVNGEAVAADSIYLPQGKEYWNAQGLVVSSVDITSPSTSLDSMVIVDANAQIYVSTDSLYLYNSSYTGEYEVTEIAKFSLQNGYMNAVGAATAAGQIQDTFAISEQNGTLRVLTTEWKADGSVENTLSIYGEDMELAGKLSGIAEGEQIYAARYVGNMAYFVTYRNTDPLFVADLSDCTNPVLCGEVELTGFSEYLHLWQDGTLLGIGYETDAETGQYKGIKLVMFDISDAAEPKVLADYVIKGSSSPAMWNYKCVLAEPEQGLIGFTYTEYTDGIENRYVLFKWDGDGFRQLLSQEVSDMYYAGIYRGIYAGDSFYIISPDEVVTFDRKNGYEEKGNLKFSKNT